MVNEQSASATSMRLTEPFDLCIIGAGIAGLNALFAASQYLPRNARVALIDRNVACGGMWNNTYPYVRLHQPHPMFTVGNFKWQWNKPNEYLATRDEVLMHFEYCVGQLRQRVNLVELYGHSVESIEEVSSPSKTEVHLQCRSLDGQGASAKFVTKRLIEAGGFDVPAPDPIETNSQQVRSITPQHISSEAGHAPVYVVGGGKTGMDTVLEIVRQQPGRQVTLINGRGTIFGNRDLFAPAGAKRWWHGHLISRSFSDLAMRYDGSNADETFEYFRENFSVAPKDSGGHFLFGLMSKQEHNEIVSGLSESVNDYFSDVIDTDSGPQMVFQSGHQRSIDAGSVIVNCTGHLYRDSKPELPYISEHGAIIRVNTRSTIHFLSTVSAYFLTHLFYLGRLPSAEIYTLDSETLFHKNRKDWQFASVTLSLMNSITLINSLPFKALDQCGLDFDRWFPLHRRVAALLDLKINGKRYLAHCQATMNRVRERHHIACGVLSAPPAKSGGSVGKAELSADQF